MSIIVLLLMPLFVQGAGEHAVVRIPSHGASATVIYTGKGYSWLLGCGHAYEGKDATKKMQFDIPCILPSGQVKIVGSILVKVDYKEDLSLVQLNEGPLDFVAPVAFDGWHEWNHRIISVGYDQMKLPATVKEAHILSEDAQRYYTTEKPIPGRSGGGLIDSERGYLIGVCQGFEAGNKGRGLYINLPTVQRFLRQAFNRPEPKKGTAPLQPIWNPPGKT